MNWWSYVILIVAFCECLCQFTADSSRCIFPSSQVPHKTASPQRSDNWYGQSYEMNFHPHSLVGWTAPWTGHCMIQALIQATWCHSLAQSCTAPVTARKPLQTATSHQCCHLQHLPWWPDFHSTWFPERIFINIRCKTGAGRSSTPALHAFAFQHWCCILHIRVACRLYMIICSYRMQHAWFQFWDDMAQTCISHARTHSESLAETSTGYTVQKYLEHLPLHSAASHIDRSLELKLSERLLQQKRTDTSLTQFILHISFQL